jgi:hypothetical protein
MTDALVCRQVLEIRKANATALSHLRGAIGSFRHSP